jgi:glycosyltransferase involved in cell wall biosynthesis
MRIVIVTTRGFHLRHLARELIAMGRDVTYFTYMPKRRIRRDGIPVERARSYFLRLQPWSGAALARPVASLVTYATEALFERADRAYARDLPPCDVVIGLSALTLECARVARARHGAKIVLERGSRHVLSQRELIARDGDPPLSQTYVDRELAGYEIADFIALPSRHACDSFRAQGVDSGRLFYNPYGVDLERFQVRPPPGGPFRMVYVGHWSYRKGCDVLSKMLAAAPDLLLTHVGTQGELPFPSTDRFASLGHRGHDELPQILARHHALVLPSREDGFGMVLTEALAAGLPVIASAMTGGPDLLGMVEAKAAIRIVPPDDPQALANAARETAAWLARRGAKASLPDEDRARLSWRAYAKRYDAFLRSIM